MVSDEQDPDRRRQISAWQRLYAVQSNTVKRNRVALFEISILRSRISDLRGFEIRISHHLQSEI